MRNIIIGCAIGLVLATLLAVLFGIMLGVRAEHQLIEDWRKVQPGMTLDEVKSLFGEPSGQFPVGDGFPEWAERSVPDDYFENHGLITYVSPKIPPQVLLIYFDHDERVVFVSSVPT